MTDTVPASTPKTSRFRRFLDHFGVGLAGLCALHCVATVLIVSGLGIGSHFLLAHEIHEFGLLLAVIVAAVAIGWGAWHHRRLGPVLVACVGLAIMASALFVGHGSEEAALTIVGVVIVSAGHLMNLRSLR
ncbi:MAG: MerC domain-containing protein [Pseudomonadota bacterium]